MASSGGFSAVTYQVKLNTGSGRRLSRCWEVCECSINGAVRRVTDVVLTIAHLDHVPEHCAPDNLLAWCHRCHLRYDAEHHKRTAYATRKAAAMTLDLFACRNEDVALRLQTPLSQGFDFQCSAGALQQA